MFCTKEYRKKRKEQVHSLKSKSLFNLLTTELMTKLAPARREAEIVAEICMEYLTHILCNTAEGQIQLEAFAGLDNHAHRPLAQSETKKITVTIFDYGDIELLEEFGLKSMQNARIMRIIEEAYRQKALLDIENLVKLVPMTKKTLRRRLIPYWNEGILLPISGLSRKYRDGLLKLREVAALECYLLGEEAEKIRQRYCLSRTHFRRVINHYRYIADTDEEDSKLAERLHIPKEQVSSLRSLAAVREVEKPNRRFGAVGAKDRYGFIAELEERCGFSPAVANHIELDLDELAREIGGRSRKDNEVVYYAVSDHEPAGKPLDECELAPVRIAYITDEERRFDTASSPTALKWNRIVRYTTQARYQGTYLNQIDLAYLIGISPAVSQRLIEEHEDIVVPTRGQMIDMGPAVSHAEEIISLHMQGFTETQIKEKTKHGYSSIERYIDSFTRIVGMLVIEGMTRAEIRKVMDCSRRLVDKYCELWHKYNCEEYQWWAQRVIMRYKAKKKRRNRG